VIFGVAGRTHLKCCHSGVRPVVRDVANDGEARSAVGAVNKRIAIATISGIEDLVEAGRAGRNVRRDRRAFARYGITYVNGEAGNPEERRSLSFYRFDVSQGRRFSP